MSRLDDLQAAADGPSWNASAVEFAQRSEEQGDAEGSRRASRYVLETGGHARGGPATCGRRRMRK